MIFLVLEIENSLLSYKFHVSAGLKNKVDISYALTFIRFESMIMKK